MSTSTRIDKIAVAARASSEVLSQVDRASSLLQQFNWAPTNGFGVLVEEGLGRAALEQARDSIAAALRTLSNTSWPTRADYDDVE